MRLAGLVAVALLAACGVRRQVPVFPTPASIPIPIGHGCKIELQTGAVGLSTEIVRFVPQKTSSGAAVRCEWLIPP